MTQPSLKDILRYLAEQTGVQVYRTRDVGRTALKKRYKDSTFACPQIQYVRLSDERQVKEPIATTFGRVACNQRLTLRQLRTQRDKFVRCALLRDWARFCGFVSNVKHLPPLHAAWEHAQQCQECIMSRTLTQSNLVQEDKLLKSARHEASSNNSQGRNFPRLTTRSNKGNATRRSTAPREHH